jgi:predicted DsbA family dithiol-disulfide isomerase
MQDRLFAHQNALGEAQLLGYANALSLDSPAFAACLKSAATAKMVNDDLAAARTLGLTGTPSFLIGEVTPDGSVRVTQRIDGAVPVQVFESALNNALATPAKAKH